MSIQTAHLLYRAARVFAPGAAEVADAELLRRFAEQQDGAAFELLLWRHGPMVWGVCRRQLGHCHDAEDAFQAAFLALARNAGGISERGAVAGWLYRVALHGSLALRKKRDRRNRRECLTANPPERLAGDDTTRAAASRELGRLIDEEVRRLPDKLRLPFLLCEVQGRCRTVVAAELKCPVGTVESRLCRARQRLRVRLARRGLTLPAALAVTVPANLRASTCRLASAPTLCGPIGDLARQAATAVLPARLLKVLAAGLLGVCVGLAALAAGKVDPAPAQPTLPSVPARDTAPPAEPPLPGGVVARIGSTRLRHDGPVTCVTFSPDGRWIATADETTACVWDAVSGRLRRRFEGASIWGRKVAFSADGKVLFTLGPGKGKDTSTWLRTFDLASGKERPAKAPPAGRPDAIFLAALAADGKLFGFQDGDTYRVHDTATEKLLQRLPLSPAGWMSPVFSPGGRAVALASGNQGVKVFDIGSSKELAAISEDKRQIYSAAFSADARVLGTVASDSTVALWDVETGRLLRRISGLEVTASCLAFSPDGKRLAVGNLQRTSVQLLDASTGKELRRFRSWPSVKQVVFAPDGKTLAAGRTLGTVSLWDVATGKPRPASCDPQNGAFNLRFTGKGLLVESDDVAVHDWRTGKVVRRYADPRSPVFEGFALSNDGRLAAQSEFDGSIRLLDAGGKLVRTLKGHSFLAAPLLFAPDGRRLFSRGYDGTVRVWDMQTGKELHKFSAGINRSGARLAVSADGKLLAASVREGPSPLILLWDTLRGRELQRWRPRINGVYALAFSPNGSVLVAAGDRREKEGSAPAPVILWSTETGTELRTLEAHQGAATAVAFTPDGRMLATGGSDAVIRVWEVAGGKERYSLTGHRSGIYALAFSKDGKHLASASADAPVFVWDLSRHFRRR